jgi:hypothetical protein
MGSKRLTFGIIGLLGLLFLLPSAMAQEETRKKDTTLANLAAVSALRCDALRRGKIATRQADIYRTEASHAYGIGRINAEGQTAAKEAAAGAAFEESGRLKRRLAGMVDGYVSARRLEWYQTVDVALKIRLEEKITVAQEILSEGCGKRSTR